MEKLITTKLNNSAISIRIPISLIKHAAKYKPDSEYIVKNQKRLAELVLEYFNLEDEETGITRLQQMIDEGIDDAYESGDECIIDKTDNL